MYIPHVTRPPANVRVPILYGGPLTRTVHYQIERQGADKNRRGPHLTQFFVS